MFFFDVLHLNRIDRKKKKKKNKHEEIDIRRVNDIADDIEMKMRHD
jgi:hypothetical protein